MRGNIKHLAILRGYNFQIAEDKMAKANFDTVKIWFVGVINCLQNAVYQGEIRDTQVITQVNHFVTQYMHESNDGNAQTFTELRQSAYELIDKVVTLNLT